MRISERVDNAVRSMAELSTTDGEPLKAEVIAERGPRLSRDGRRGGGIQTPGEEHDGGSNGGRGGVGGRRHGRAILARIGFQAKAAEEPTTERPGMPAGFGAVARDREGSPSAETAQRPRFFPLDG